ncbi:unnamed protein product [Schistosoma turkestanicum]|nr:unnamed protein product [Schistosoma turkestanicum]
MDGLSGPVYESTPKNYRKRSIRQINFATPHIPLAGGGAKRGRLAAEQLNLSNQETPVDAQSDVNTNVSSSRRSVNKQLAQPKRVVATENRSRQNNWMYVNRKETSASKTSRVSPIKSQQQQHRSTGRQLQLVQQTQQQQSSRTGATLTSGDNRTKRKKKVTAGIKALKEIRAFQRSTNLLLRKLPFARLVRSITVRSLGPDYLSYRWQAICFLALQEAAEAFVVHLFECAQRCAIHARRITVMSKDIQLVTHLQNIPTTSQFTQYHHTVLSQHHQHLQPHKPLPLGHLTQPKTKQHRHSDYSQQSNVDEDDSS